MKLVGKFSKNMSEEKITRISKGIGVLIFVMSIVTMIGAFEK